MNADKSDHFLSACIRGSKNSVFMKSVRATHPRLDFLADELFAARFLKSSRYNLPLDFAWNDKYSVEIGEKQVPRLDAHAADFDQAAEIQNLCANGRVLRESPAGKYWPVLFQHFGRVAVKPID